MLHKFIPDKLLPPEQTLFLYVGHEKPSQHLTTVTNILHIPLAYLHHPGKYNDFHMHQPLSEVLQPYPNIRTVIVIISLSIHINDSYAYLNVQYLNDIEHHLTNNYNHHVSIIIAIDSNVHEALGFYPAKVKEQLLDDLFDQLKTRPTHWHLQEPLTISYILGILIFQEFRLSFKLTFSTISNTKLYDTLKSCIEEQYHQAPLMLLHFDTKSESNNEHIITFTLGIQSDYSYQRLHSTDYSEYYEIPTESANCHVVSWQTRNTDTIDGIHKRKTNRELTEQPSFFRDLIHQLRSVLCSLKIGKHANTAKTPSKPDDSHEFLLGFNISDPNTAKIPFGLHSGNIISKFPSYLYTRYDIVCDMVQDNNNNPYIRIGVGDYQRSKMYIPFVELQPQQVTDSYIRQTIQRIADWFECKKRSKSEWLKFPLSTRLLEHAHCYTGCDESVMFYCIGHDTPCDQFTCTTHAVGWYRDLFNMGYMFCPSCYARAIASESRLISQNSRDFRNSMASPELLTNRRV